VGGGAAGAVINTVVSAYRARRQPVGRRIEVVPVFRPSGSASQLRAEIATTHQGSTETFQNLFLAEIQVANRGNRDLEEFGFGATLGEGDKCIFVEAEAAVEAEAVFEAEAVTEAVSETTEPKKKGGFFGRMFKRKDKKKETQAEPPAPTAPAKTKAAASPPPPAVPAKLAESASPSPEDEMPDFFVQDDPAHGATAKPVGEDEMADFLMGLNEKEE
jgi:hypothetical protein